MNPQLRKKRTWTVADFAEHMGISHKAARTLLRRLDEELHGMLLRPSEGKNRRFTFLPAVLFRAMPDYAEQMQTLEARLDAVEEEQAEFRAHQKIVVGQVGRNSREIERLRLRLRVA